MAVIIIIIFIPTFLPSFIRSNKHVESAWNKTNLFVLSLSLRSNINYSWFSRITVASSQTQHLLTPPCSWKDGRKYVLPSFSLNSKSPVERYDATPSFRSSSQQTIDKMIRKVESSYCSWVWSLSALELTLPWFNTSTLDSQRPSSQRIIQTCSWYPVCVQPCCSSQKNIREAQCVHDEAVA